MKRILLYDCDYIANSSRFYNDLSLRLSSYHKQQNDKVIVATSSNLFQMKYDIVYIIRENDKSPLPPLWVMDDSNAVMYGAATQYFSKHKQVPNIIYSIRPDYLLFNKKITTFSKWERTEFIRFFNGFYEIPIQQDESNAFDKTKIRLVVDEFLWDVPPQALIAKLKILQTKKNVAFKYPIKIKTLLENTEVLENFKKIHFAKGYKNKLINNYGESIEKCKEIIDFISSFEKIAFFKPVSFRSIRENYQTAESARKDLFRAFEILAYSKQKEVRIIFSCPKTKCSIYWDYFIVLKRITNHKFQRSLVEVFLEYSTGYISKSIEEIINNEQEWLSYYTRMCVYLLAKYHNEIGDFLLIQWGDKKLDIEIDYKYLERII